MMSEIRFSDGLPERGAVAGNNWTAEELAEKKCGDAIGAANGNEGRRGKHDTG